MFLLFCRPACKWGLDWFRTWAIAATSNRIQDLAGICSHEQHFNFRLKRLPDGTFISSLSAEYPSTLASAIIDIIERWVSQATTFNFDVSLWKSLLAKAPFSQGPRITDGAGNSSSANGTIPKTQDTFKEVRRRWTSRILKLNLHTRFAKACANNQADPFITDDELFPFLQDLQECFPNQKFDPSILPFQPFRLDVFHQLLQLSPDPDTDIALLLKEGIPSGAFSPLQPIGLWGPNTKQKPEEPRLQICHENWSSANSEPNMTRSLIGSWRRSPISAQLKKDGPKALPCANWESYVQITGALG